MLNHPPYTHEKVNNIKIIKRWFTYHRFDNTKTNAEDFAAILSYNSLQPHGINYKNIDCSYFIYLSIFYYNKHAGYALINSLKNVEEYLKTNYNIYINSFYPLAIYFALLAENKNLWHDSMHKYFELVPINKLTPGSIIAWGFESFLNPKTNSFKLEFDTGHVGCVTNSDGSNIKFCHSVPRKDDPKSIKQGGPTETDYTLSGHILQGLSKGMRVGGAMRLKGYGPSFVPVDNPAIVYPI